MIHNFGMGRWLHFCLSRQKDMMMVRPRWLHFPWQSSFLHLLHLTNHYLNTPMTNMLNFQPASIKPSLIIHKLVYASCRRGCRPRVVSDNRGSLTSLAENALTAQAYLHLLILHSLNVCGSFLSMSVFLSKEHFMAFQWQTYSRLLRNACCRQWEKRLGIFTAKGENCRFNESFNTILWDVHVEVPWKNVQSPKQRRTHTHVHLEEYYKVKCHCEATGVNTNFVTFRRVGLGTIDWRTIQPILISSPIYYESTP